jgi:general stress protein 26
MDPQQTERPTAQTAAKLWGMIRDIPVAMLTSDDDGVLRSRPMVAAQRDFDGTLRFLSHAGSHKVQQDARVAVTYADPGRQHYGSISGRAKVVREEALLRTHWSEALRTCGLIAAVGS